MAVFAGDSAADESEGSDRTTAHLPDHQAELIDLALKANPRTVVVLSTGAPVVGDWMATAPALIQAWFPGQESGHAITDVLFGIANPSGKLPMTFPKRLEDHPSFANFPGKAGEVRYAEGVLVGYRYFDAKNIAPEFPFGFGLSYTTFALRDVGVEKTAGGGAIVHVHVRNTGTREGAEVVQVYVHDEAAGPGRADAVDQALAGFAKVRLSPGEERENPHECQAPGLRPLQSAVHDWVRRPGRFEIRVGTSSRDVRLRTVIDSAP